MIKDDDRLIPSTWRKWLEDKGIQPGSVECLTTALTRMTLSVGPMKRGGYLATMNSVVASLTDIFGKDLDRTLSVLHIVETFGLRFTSTRNLQSFVNRLSDLSKNKLDVIETSDSNYGPQAKRLIAVTAMLALTKDRRIILSENPPVLPDPQDLDALLLAIEFFLSFPEIRDVCDRVMFYEEIYGPLRLWELFTAARLSGFRRVDLRKVIEELSFTGGLMALLMIERGDLTQESLTLCLQEPDLLRYTFNDQALLRHLVDQWEQVGRPCLLREFWDIGGSAADWNNHLTAKAALEALKTETVLPRLQAIPSGDANTSPPTRPVEQKPTGNKRHHPNFKDDGEQASADFDALCSELNVCASFPDLDGDLVSAVLVYGLLQTGERLATADSLPSRDDKKVWRQVKDHVSLTSRRQLVKAMRSLVDAHLISYTGGNYQLARKNPRFPKANTLLSQLWGLVAKYST